MTISKTYQQLRYVYITNTPNNYPPIKVSTADYYQQDNPSQTGWQALPNSFINTMLSPSQWWDITRTFSAMRVDKVEGTAFNMIPLTETVAIQGNTTFTAFNNTLYALGYADNKYETRLIDWSVMGINFNLYQKEGIQLQTRGGGMARMNLPNYRHYKTGVPSNIMKFPKDGRPQADVQYPCGGGTYWDPFNCPDDLMELRPGKNAIKYVWSRRPDDTQEMYSLDANVYTNPCKRPTFESEQAAWEISTAYIQNMDWGPTPLVDAWAYNDQLWSSVTSGHIFKDNDFEYSVRLAPPHGMFNAKWPIPNWFIKLIPLYDSNNTLIQTTAQIAWLTKVTVTGEPRSAGAHFGPNIDNGCGGMELFANQADTMSWNTSVYGTIGRYSLPTVIGHSASHRPRFGVDTLTKIFTNQTTNSAEKMLHDPYSGPDEIMSETSVIAGGK
uniref:VP1 n=1 Tax=Turdus pallidus Chaphamaparvovirus TaxID=2794492 RepID=A0A8A4XCB9_9VIRU|nr:MAG: VP1 [Turdus pallidus Chaphamaparvovirus]